jgi:hypothetical protein
MAKIEVTPVTSGYNVAALNETLQSIEDEFKNKVVYRDEVSPMERPLDMNGNDILNAGEVTADQVQVGSIVLNEETIGDMSRARDEAVEATRTILDTLSTIGSGGLPGVKVAQRIEADGVSTVYSLTTTPLSTLQTDVYINGVYQQKNSYALAGTLPVTLVFSEAPPAPTVPGERNIEVIVSEAVMIGEDGLRTDLASPIGSSMVGYTPADAGAVPTNVQSKLREKISPEDFGAVGDGATDDTSAFTLLQAAHTGKRVDLNGKTYAVSSVPRDIAAFNGFFNVGTSTIRASGDFTLFGTKSTTPINIMRDAQVANAALLYDLTRVGTSPNNVIQSIAVDEVNGYLYTHHVSLTFAPPDEATVINRFLLDGGTNQTALDSSAADVRLGHQGLAVEYLESGETKLWTSAPYGAGNGTKAVRFDYVPSASGALANLQTYQLFPTDTSSQATSPCISSCGRFLLVEKNATVGGLSGNFVRVFDLKELREGGAGDYSNEFLSEFFVRVTQGEPATPAFQNMACDGAYVYIIAGSSNVDAAHTLAVYTLAGEPVVEHRDFSVGKEQARSTGTGTVYEPEGLAIANIEGRPVLLSQIAAGDSGARKCLIFGLGLRASENEQYVVLGSNVNTSVATYDNILFDTTSVDNTMTGVFFSPDGLNMYSSGSSNDRVYRWRLSTPWNVSTASFVGFFSVASQDTDPRDLYFRQDGLAFYIIGNQIDAVFQYALTTPWDISTASYTSKSFSVLDRQASPQGIYFKPDGAKMYVVGQTGTDFVLQYALSTAWDVTTAAFEKQFSVNSQENFSYTLAFSNDGRWMFSGGIANNKVSRYRMIRPWDVGTAAYVDQLDVSSLDSTLGALYVRPDGGKMYISGTTTDDIFQLSMPVAEQWVTGTFNVSGSLNVFQNLTVGGSLALTTPRTPASATANGVAGTVCWDASYIYVCTAPNSWKRVAIATW